jgi:hypothetical protein
MKTTGRSPSISQPYRDCIAIHSNTFVENREKYLAAFYEFYLAKVKLASKTQEAFVSSLGDIFVVTDAHSSVTDSRKIDKLIFTLDKVLKTVISEILQFHVSKVVDTRGSDMLEEVRNYINNSIIYERELSISELKSGGSNRRKVATVPKHLFNSVLVKAKTFRANFESIQKVNEHMKSQFIKYKEAVDTKYGGHDAKLAAFVETISQKNKQISNLTETISQLQASLSQSREQTQNLASSLAAHTRAAVQTHVSSHIQTDTPHNQTAASHIQTEPISSVQFSEDSLAQAYRASESESEVKSESAPQGVSKPQETPTESDTPNADSKYLTLEQQIEEDEEDMVDEKHGGGTSPIQNPTYQRPLINSTPDFPNSGESSVEITDAVSSFNDIVEADEEDFDDFKDMVDTESAAATTETTSAPRKKRTMSDYN